jgi:hypothetical protein
MAIFVTAATTALVAVLGFLFTYLHTRRLQERNDQLQWVNRQLGELYGPLFALSDATRISYEAFCEKYKELRNETDWESISPEYASAWQLWMTTVFQPSNKRMFELIVSNGDLLVDEAMPACVSEFCAHVASYDVTISLWAKGNTSEAFAAVDYPPLFTDYVRHSYSLLKRRQAALLADKT